MQNVTLLILPSKKYLAVLVRKFKQHLKEEERIRRSWLCLFRVIIIQVATGFQLKSSNYLRTNLISQLGEGSLGFDWVALQEGGLTSSSYNNQQYSDFHEILCNQNHHNSKRDYLEQDLKVYEIKSGHFRGVILETISPTSSFFYIILTYFHSILKDFVSRKQYIKDSSVSYIK